MRVFPILHFSYTLSSLCYIIVKLFIFCNPWEKETSLQGLFFSDNWQIQKKKETIPKKDFLVSEAIFH